MSTYQHPQTEHEALRRWFMLTYADACGAVNWYRARASGGQNVGIAAMPLHTAQRIVREANQMGLGLEYDAEGQDVITFVPVTDS